MAVLALPIANRNFLDRAILSEELGFTESFEEFFFADVGCQTCHINEVFLNDSDTDQVLSVFLFNLALLEFFLSLFLCPFLLILLDVCSELGDPVNLLVWDWCHVGECHSLLRRDNFPLDCLLIVWSSTCRAQTVHVRLDVVEAELAYL